MVNLAQSEPCASGTINSRLSIVKAILRCTAFLAGILVPLVLLAFLDKIPDNPGEVKQCQFAQNRSLQAGPQLDPKTKVALFLPGFVSSHQHADLTVLFAVERTTASAGSTYLRSVADSSPPVSAS